MRSRIVVGIVAGLIGGVVFGMMMQMMAAPDGKPMMAMVAQVVRSESLVVGWLYHLFNSAVIGGIFGWLLGNRIGGYGAGLLWGAFVPGWIFYSGTWVISVLFLLRAIGDFRFVGFFKSVTDTNFARWDTILFSPLCLFIAVVAFLISYYQAK